MAYRPKSDSENRSADGDSDQPSSKIFRSLVNSEAGRSFRINETASQQGNAFPKGSSSSTNGQGLPARASGGTASFNRRRPSSTSSGASSFTNKSGRDGDDPRSGRANEAIQLRESLANHQARGGTSLPRGKTFERKRAANIADQYQDDDEDDENVTPNTGKSLAQRSTLVAQLGAMQDRQEGGEAGIKARDAAHKSIISRFKSTTQNTAAESDDGAEDDIAALA